ncbi:MAG: hypothetical protein IKD72_00960 [Clostridia bacterium]|nr:hypothetical protein [Clostridia bacterium]
MELKWDENAQIRIRTEGGDVIISANRAGLRSLSNHLLSLAGEPAGSHLHLDADNALEDGSQPCILEHIE